ncbi:pentatricopeptide repeat-containing protein At1g43980, mitochondrial-like [Pistacia vera]|uniref:pentatricopeptide repeat-containing protein At1g43980, mitochondrial-like n=1 Tax=Pistacia vera TaxID=55513 RepID=UPI0012632E38|nr:pentatricopeptide repeat-containing protein At1g43980, mitochondrial-like [Pistacia vera]XP_031259120.1 pentatricopeptide repeat-containing protein At1g43980, mitochondrial-like [Pistacia vera]
MISSYARHGFGEDAMQLFVLSLREDFRPTEFTLSSVVSSTTDLPVECGSQVHSLAIKLGFESDAVVGSSLIDMYSKFGSVDSAMKIFVDMEIKDLISWNTIIMGLSHNGRLAQTLDMFNELLKYGPYPDQVTLAGVLLACNYGGFVDEGMIIFSSMKEVYGVIPGDEHYVCIIDLLCRAGKLREATDVIKTMPYEPSYLIWESILRACAIYGDLKLLENVAERMMDLQPESLLPYLLLAQAYEMRGRWEGVVRVRKAMRQKGVVKKVTGCSWIGIRNHLYTFNAEQLQHHGGKEIYLFLRLLIWEMEDEGCVYLQHDKLDAAGE